MKTKPQFKLVEDQSQLADLQEQWTKSLLAPQDGMYERFREMADHWSIELSGQTIGFAVADEDNGMMNFYLEPQHHPLATEYLQAFVEQEKISQALLGTHNPLALTAALHLQKGVEVNSLLFMDIGTDATSIFSMLSGEGVRPAEVLTKTIQQPAATQLKHAQLSDLERLISFYDDGDVGPREWLENYLKGHVEKGSCYFLERDNTIIGACEVRVSESQLGLADIGMIVGEGYRRQGLGTYLLGQARRLARASGKIPICSCEADNIGSRKSIEANGFRNVHSMLRLSF